MEIVQIQFNWGRFCRYCYNITQHEEEEENQILWTFKDRLTPFLLFFPPTSIWYWGNKEKKKGGYILHTDIWKILSFSLKITTTWSWSQVWKESCSYLPFWNPQRHTVLRKLLFHRKRSQLSSKDWASSSSKLHGIGELHKWCWKWVRVVGLEDEVSRKTCTGYICVSFTSCHERAF